MAERLLISASSDNDLENEEKKNNNGENKRSQHSLQTQRRLEIKLAKLDNTNSETLESSKNYISELQDENPSEMKSDDKEEKNILKEKDSNSCAVITNKIIEEKNKNAIKIISDEPVVSKVNIANYKREDVASENDELKNLKRKLKDLKNENDKANKRKKELKKLIEEKDFQIRQLSDLNKKLQTELVEKFQEQKEEIAKLMNHSNEEAHNVNGNYDMNFPTFLRTRTTDDIRRVHIGNDIWITERAFIKINTRSCSARHLASNILISVFEEEILLNSTITGHETNKKATAGHQKQITQKLDEKKICACEKLYEHLLLKNSPKFKQTKKVYGKTIKVVLEVEQRMFKHYAQKKIADLKSSVDNCRKKEKKEKSMCDNNIINKVNDEINQANNEVNEVNNKMNEDNEIEEEKDEIYDWSPPGHSSSYKSSITDEEYTENKI